MARFELSAIGACESDDGIFSFLKNMFKKHIKESKIQLTETLRSLGYGP